MRYILTLCFLLFTSLTWADQLIIEPDMGREPILAAIRNSHYSLNLVMYGFTDASILNALLDQKSKDTAIKIILEGSPYENEDENKKTIEALNQRHVNLQASVPGIRLIHQKTLISDHRQALVMTFNLTPSTFKNDNERNFALMVDDAKKVKEIEDVFEADWNHRPSGQHSPDIFYSPDDSRAKLLRLIANAKNSLDIYAQTITDYELTGALAKAASQGITINLLISNKIDDKRARYLENAGVKIRYSKHYYIHAKVFIIDNNKALIGSINLTRPSLDTNRELAIMTSDPTVIKQLSATFASDWQAEQGRNIHAKHFPPRAHHSLKKGKFRA